MASSRKARLAGWEFAALGAVSFALSGCQHGTSPGSTATGVRQALPDAKVTLQSLIDKAKDGQAVTVPRARYVSDKGVLIEKRRRLRIVYEKGTQILAKDTYEDVIAVVGSADVRIENAFVSHVKPRQEYDCHGSVVRISDSKSVSIVNCDLNGCGAVGVYARDSSGVTISNCLVHHNTWNALYFDGCEEIEVVGNVIEDNANLFQMYRVSGVMWHDNLIRRNGGYWAKREPRPGLKP